MWRINAPPAMHYCYMRTVTSIVIAFALAGCAAGASSNPAFTAASVGVQAGQVSPVAVGAQVGIQAGTPPVVAGARAGSELG